jgi:hypothetical protein
MATEANELGASTLKALEVVQKITAAQLQAAQELASRVHAKGRDDPVLIAGLVQAMATNWNAVISASTKSS